MSDHVTTRVEGRINAPASRVWDYLSWRGAAKLKNVSVIDHVSLEDDGNEKGSVRVLHLKDGTSISEYVEDINDDEHWYVYKPTSLGSLPVSDYTGRLEVKEDGPGSSRVIIQSHCIPVGISVAEWQEAYTELETAVIDFVRQQVEGA
jgi:hypothetical protein